MSIACDLRFKFGGLKFKFYQNEGDRFYQNL